MMDIEISTVTKFFAAILRKLLNPVPNSAEITILNIAMYVLILDDPITAREIRDVLTKLRRDKAASICGILPGILYCLTMNC